MTKLEVYVEFHFTSCEPPSLHYQFPSGKMFTACFKLPHVRLLGKFYNNMLKGFVQYCM